MNDDARRQHRQAVVTILLAGMAAAFTLLVLILLTGGWFVYLALLAGGMALFGLLHYVLWGRGLTRETAGEREEEQLHRRALDEGEPPDEPRTGYFA
jgi:hypothetical protein